MGWISVEHKSLSVILHLYVWLGQTIRKEYTTSGMLLEEVNELFCASMNKRMCKVPVHVTGIESPQLMYHSHSPLKSYLACRYTQSLLELPFSRLDVLIHQNVRNPIEGFNPPLGEGLSLLRRSPETCISLLKSTAILRSCDTICRPQKGKKGIISVRSGFGFSKPNAIIHFKIAWCFLALSLDPELATLMLTNQFRCRFFCAFNFVYEQGSIFAGARIIQRHVPRKLP